MKDTREYVTGIEYSPLLGGFVAVLSDGRGFFLTAPNSRFDKGVSFTISRSGTIKNSTSSINCSWTTLYLYSSQQLIPQFCLDEMTLYTYLSLFPCLYLNYQTLRGIWASDLRDATCVHANHKYRLIVYGCHRSVL